MWLIPIIEDIKNKRYESVIQKKVIMFTLKLLDTSSPESAFWFIIKTRRWKINQTQHTLLVYPY